VLPTLCACPKGAMADSTGGAVRDGAVLLLLTMLPMLVSEPSEAALEAGGEALVTPPATVVALLITLVVWPAARASFVRPLRLLLLRAAVAPVEAELGPSGSGIVLAAALSEAVPWGASS
jgi:hypothetical protein